MKNNNIRTDYSIVSRGTEKYNNHGYIGISESIKGYRYLQNIDHNILESQIDQFSLKFKDSFTIENIALSRFQLIFELLFLRVNKYISDNILIVGFGNLGIGTLISLLDKKITNISILVKEKRKYMEKAIEQIQHQYNVSIPLLIYDEINMANYRSIIECSGSGQAIQTIIEKCNNLTNLFIVSTPRDNNYLINPLIINRKNLNIFGGHEFNGIKQEIRNKLFIRILKRNSGKVFINDFVQIYPYSDSKLNAIKKQKNNLIEIFEY